MLNTKKIKRYGNEIKYNYLTKKYIIYIFLIVVTIVGFLIGSLINKNMTIIEEKFFKNYIDSYFINFKLVDTMKSKLVIESIFKYGKSIILIWLLGFFKFGIIFSVSILAIKFISLSLVTSFFIGYYGLSGFLYAIFLYIPQNIMLLPIYFYVTYYSINFNWKKKSNYFRGSFLEYFLILLITISGVFLISLYETYITPNLVNYIINIKK